MFVRIVGILILAAVFPLITTIALPVHTVSAAPVLTENFANNSFNSSLWKLSTQGNGPSVAVANDRLEITISSTSTNDPSIGGFGAGIGSRCLLNGDFDMQVGFQLLVWPAQNGVRVGIGPSVGGLGAGGTPYAVERDSFSTGDTIPGEFYVTHMLDSVRGVNSTKDLSGYLRITRTGSTGTGYFMNSTVWRPIHTGPVVTSEVGFGFEAWSHDYLFSHQTEKVAFYNFTLNSGQLQCPRMSATPASGPVGTLVTVNGAGLPTVQGYPANFPSVRMSFDDMFLGTTTNNAGSFTFTFNVPLSQVGMHQIKAIDSATGTNETATFQVTASSAGLSISLTVGAIYFPGDTVITTVLVTSAGVQVTSPGLQLHLSLTGPENSSTILNTTSIGNGLFRSSYILSKTAQIGTYSLVATANAPNIGSGTGLGGFEVKLPWLSSQASTLAVAGAVSASALAVGLVSWRKGAFKRSRYDTNWNA